MSDRLSHFSDKKSRIFLRTADWNEKESKTYREALKDEDFKRRNLWFE